MPSPTPPPNGIRKRPARRKQPSQSSPAAQQAPQAVQPVVETSAVAPVSDGRQAELDHADALRLGTIQEMVDAITDDGGDVNAAKLRAAMQEALDREAAHDNALLANVAADEPKLEAALAQLRAKRQDIEEAERARASASCLALEMIVTGCEFATTHFPDAASGETMPTFTMNRPCVIGKAGPDNDCRMCIHHTRTVLDVPQHQKRYPRNGLVIPIRNNQEADALAYFLKATGMLQLRHVDSEIHFIELALTNIARTREELARREAERVRRGPQFR